jgi:hypothetical protein
VPRYLIRVDITETFEVMVDAPGEDVAKALVEHERVTEEGGLSAFFFATPNVAYSAEAVAAEAVTATPGITFDEAMHSADELLEFYGDAVT